MESIRPRAAGRFRPAAGTGSVAGEHQRLHWQHRRLDAQQRRMHDAHRVGHACTMPTVSAMWEVRQRPVESVPLAISSCNVLGAGQRSASAPPREPAQWPENTSVCTGSTSAWMRSSTACTMPTVSTMW
ncbi:hypothetical protein LNKW23_02640 [Paralimibaculum aggregatum]|uniref:Uncharacterized protein n=1 Tax=Paralimibaculum aggregatum TaxID=3036245 RepID=A0ABQ6LHD0_9RHOB|nr:hypothetical protein LNKW23_02640 [Limibaculum sp. NKW23]